MQQTTSSTRTFITPPKVEEPPKQKRELPKVHLKFSPWTVVAVLAIFSAFMLVQYKDAKHKLQGNNSVAAATAQVSSITGKVGKLILLPTNEKPSLVTVKDASKLSSEQFYANAKDGDVTLVYSKAQKAILYRPSQNIIVNVANVTVNSSASQ